MRHAQTRAVLFIGHDHAPDRPGGARGAVGRKALVAWEATEAHSSTLPASVWRLVEQIGAGKRSEGVRWLVEGRVKAEAQD